jgi:hypothetical protein
MTSDNLLLVLCWRKLEDSKPVEQYCSEQSLQIRPNLLKFGGGRFSKFGTFYPKFGTIHPKFSIKIRFSHVWFFHSTEFLNHGSEIDRDDAYIWYVLTSFLFRIGVFYHGSTKLLLVHGSWCICLQSQAFRFVLGPSKWERAHVYRSCSTPPYSWEVFGSLGSFRGIIIASILLDSFRKLF